MPKASYKRHYVQVPLSKGAYEAVQRRAQLGDRSAASVMRDAVEIARRVWRAEDAARAAAVADIAFARAAE